jgi:hypothetical protein
VSTPSPLTSGREPPVPTDLAHDGLWLLVKGVRILEHA